MFTSSQFASRSTLSTDVAIQSMTEYLYDSFADNKFSIGVFLDLTKAFDTISRTILLEKLSHYRVREVARRRFHSYLESRKQFTQTNEVKSSTLYNK